MSNRWLFSHSVRQIVEASFCEGERRLPLFGHDDNTLFAVADGWLKPYQVADSFRGDIGLLVARAAIGDGQGRPDIHCQRFRLDKIIRDDQDPSTLRLQLDPYLSPDGRRIVIAGGELALHIGSDHPYGSTFNDRPITPLDFWGLEVAPAAAAESQPLLQVA